MGRVVFQSGASCLLKWGELSSKVGRVVFLKWASFLWGRVVVVVSTSLFFQENHVDTCEFLRFNTLRLNTCTPPISSSYIVLAIKCFPIHHDKHATNFNLCTLVYTSS